MNKEFYQGNREKLYAQMKENALLVLFSGTEVRKTNDEFYPFYTNRNFLYLTGLAGPESWPAEQPPNLFCLLPHWMVLF